MTAIPLFQNETPVPPGLAVVVWALVAWTAYLLVIALGLWWVRRKSDQQLQQRSEAATEAAAGQPDQPSPIDRLQMGVAPVIVGLLTHPLTNEPYTIALSGGWGSGKSSVMRQIEAQLRDERFSFKAVQINVWHSQQEDQLLTGFLRQILAVCDSPGFRWRQIKHNLRTLGFGRTLYRAGLLALALPVLLLTVVALLRGFCQYVDASQFFGPGSHASAWLGELRQSNLGQWLAQHLNAPFYVIRNLRHALPASEAKPDGASAVQLFPSLSVLLAGVTLIGSLVASLRNLPGLLRPLVDLIPYQQQYELAQGQANFRQRYQDDFGNIIRDAAGETLVIFVDDIDRISGARVLELLETLNFIVTSAQARRSGGTPGAKLYFVLAMNVAEVVRVLGPVLDPQQKLKTDEAREQLAANYLSKLVDLTVNIPSLQGRDIASLYDLVSDTKPTAS